jgi:chromosome segregation ATPase
MSATDTQSRSDPRTPAEPRGTAPPPHKRPWGWIALTVLLVAGLVGLGVYAANVNSDLDDANAKVASQQQELDAAQDTGAGVAAAKAAYDDLSAGLGAAQQDASQAADQAAQQLEQAEQAAAEAQGTADDVQRQLDAAEAKAASAATCAQSFLSAFGGVFSGSSVRAGIEATVAELKALQPQCEQALTEAGSGS